MDQGLAEKEIDKLLQDVKIYENECCRVCLVVTGCELVPMATLNLAASYRVVTGLPFADDDGLPQTLCTECVALLDTCLKFRTDSQRGYQCLFAMQEKKKLSSVQETRTKSEEADFSDNEIMENDQNPKTNDTDSSDHRNIHENSDTEELKSEVTDFSDNEIMENDQNPKTNNTDSSDHRNIHENSDTEELKSEVTDFSDNEIMENDQNPKTNNTDSSDHETIQNEINGIDEIKSEVTDFSDNEIMENDQNPKTNNTDSSDHRAIHENSDIEELKSEVTDFSDNEIMDNDQNPKTNDTNSSDHEKIQNGSNDIDKIKTKDVNNTTNDTKPEKFVPITLKGKPFVSNIEENRNNARIMTINEGVQPKRVNGENYESAWDLFEVSELSLHEQRESWLTRSRSEGYLKSFFKCEHCFQGFKHEKTFKEHMICHNEESGANACPICLRRFTRPGLLNRHKQGAHAQYYACKQCEFTSTCKKMAEEHIAWHKGVVHKCEQCDMTFDKRTTLSTHVRLRHPSDYHVCCMCGLSFLGDKGLQIHSRRAHRSEDWQFTEQNPSCAECNIVFVSMEALETHRAVALRHGPTNRSTAVPEKRKDSTDERTVVPEEIKNSYIGSTAVPENRTNSTDDSTAVPEKRKKMCHSDKKGIKKRKIDVTKKKRKRKTKEVNIECEECQMVLPSLKAHVLHYKYDHPQLTRPVPGTKLLCEVCGASFKCQAKFRDHTLLHVRGAIFQCDICKKLLKTKKMLTFHIQAHTSKYLCHLCGKVFPYLTSRNRHVANAHKEVKDIECHICKKLFKSRATCKDHIEFTHYNKERKSKHNTNVKRRYTRRDKTKDRAVCDICNKYFQNFSNRDRHLRDFHKEENDVQCTICDKYFKSVASLKVHTTHVHHKKPWPNRKRCRATINKTQTKRRKTETVQEEYDT